MRTFLSIGILLSFCRVVLADSYTFQMAQNTIETLESAITIFYLDTGRIPTESEGLAALVEAPSDLEGWDGPYMPRVPVDPWGNPYQYRATGIAVDSIGIHSLGRNGIDESGYGDDISSWAGYDSRYYKVPWNGTQIAAVLIAGTLLLCILTFAIWRYQRRRQTAA